MLKLSWRLPLACFTLAALAAGLRAEPDPDPIHHWEVEYESGLFWRFTGDATPLSYTIAPQMLTVKTPYVGVPRPFHGGDLLLRGRWTLLMEPIIRGPDHHFIGGTSSGDMEWWNHARTRALFFSAGGGVGWVDSQGHEIPGAQGENFNYTFFFYPGARVRFKSGMFLGAGAYFQHISNHGLNKVNPGLNAIGPVLSVGWALPRYLP